MYPGRPSGVLMFGMYSLLSALLTLVMASGTLTTESPDRQRCQQVMKHCIHLFDLHYSEETCITLEDAISCLNSSGEAFCGVNTQAPGKNWAHSEPGQKSNGVYTEHESSPSSRQFESNPHSKSAPGQQDRGVHSGSGTAMDSGGKTKPHTDIPAMVSGLMEMLEAAKLEYNQRCQSADTDDKTNTATWSTLSALTGLLCFIVLSLAGGGGYL